MKTDEILSIWLNSAMYVLSCFMFFSIILHAEEGVNWCNHTHDSNYVLEWDETNSKDLSERTLLVKNKLSGNIFAILKGEASYEPADHFYIDDYNFDGCQDISWVNGMNANGDVTYEVFLYSKASSTFIYSDDLSVIPNLKISQQPNCLSGSSAKTYGDFFGGTNSTYCWINSTLVETERSELSMDTEHMCSKSQKYRLNSDGHLNLQKESCESF
ncbi:MULTISPECIES: hypothetical protein [unclassified Methylophilus]|uniref:XAC2610-related protein n=1 Tax=unclassified Methylophilus TaxID=2630143 RepID=UPI0007012A1B|nr:MULTISPECIES: hypothetical protein [unclassified Methylophilus]KQT41229.1 hypothetical protein ASG34_10755 [Methylophilus sp. Leaf416]KQT57751.1 hypothetical protein ASG44_12355 [Methylophilus sp. Leaf459]